MLKAGTESGSDKWRLAQPSTGIDFIMSTTSNTSTHLIVQMENSTLRDSCRGDTVACVKSRVIEKIGNKYLSHFVKPQYMYVEHPPDWGGSIGRKKWTTNLSMVKKNPVMYEYLPGIAAHEFGHSGGLGDGANYQDIMGPWIPGEPKENISSDDKQGMGAIYNNHSSH